MAAHLEAVPGARAVVNFAPLFEKLRHHDDLTAAEATAAMDGRDFIIPDDVKSVAPAVLPLTIAVQSPAWNASCISGNRSHM